MKHYQVFFKFEGEVDVQANSYEEAKDIAEGYAYASLQYNGSFEIDDINEFTPKGDI